MCIPMPIGHVRAPAMTEGIAGTNETPALTQRDVGEDVLEWAGRDSNARPLLGTPVSNSQPSFTSPSFPLQGRGAMMLVRCGRCHQVGGRNRKPHR